MRRTVACSADETYHAIEGAFDPNGVRQKADRRRSSRDVRSFSFTNAEGHPKAGRDRPGVAIG